MTEHSDRLRALLDAEAAESAPPTGARERNWTAVSRALGFVPDPTDGGPEGGDGGPTPGAEGAATGVAATAAKGGPLLKLVVGSTLAIGAASAIASSISDTEEQVGSSMRTERVSLSAEPLESPPAPSDEVPISTPSPGEPPTHVESDRVSGTPERARVQRPESRPSERPKPEPPRSESRRESVPGTATSSLAAELELIRRAKRAFETGDFEEVLVVTKQHATAHPNGELTPDNLSLRAAALCKLGRRARGQALLNELRERWPRAPIGRDARSACEDEP